MKSVLLMALMDQSRRRDPRGRKSKGDRDRQTFLPPAAFGAIVRLDAAQQGVTLADLLLRIVRDAYGLESFSAEALEQLAASLGLEAAEVDHETARIMKTPAAQQRRGSTTRQEELPIRTAA
ncbi:hypothetical protein SAMN06295924_1255 [Rathayibacter rathayi NCPPB 2980 = VKM Ac-1601]|nr:hypothetical protein FB469_3136 [Rathayibacter rathayi]SOE06042.1 hypothetical protein SAMN06295924_1255 [Rathayibacter rathayi NCPPB 2980 = VKM Ac-1601]